MVPVLVHETKTFALELHSLLKELDPVRWRAEKKQTIKEKIIRLENEVSRLYNELQGRAHELQAKVQTKKLTPAITERLHHIHGLLTELKHFHIEAKPAKQYLNSLRKRIENGYQELALEMESYSVELPGIRPTNYMRSFFHLSSAMLALFFIEIVPAPVYLIYLSMGFALTIWTLELLNRVNSKAREKILKFFAPIGHPHEKYKINSSTWFASSMVLMALTQMPVLSAIGVTILGFSDPAAAMIGRKWGRTKLFAGRSLEGSLAFFIVGTVTVYALLSCFHPIGDNRQILTVAAASALAGAIGELFGKYPDDNITVPLSSALGGFIALSVIF